MTALSNIRRFYSGLNLSGLGIPFLVLIIIGMLVIPLPPYALDFLFTFNIAVSLLVIMVAISTKRPLEFSSFPTVLLFATMLRLGLNVASTRVILVNGHKGPHAAGDVIASFGEFVIAGNYFVGFVIFVILMVINFIVITKGAGRVSEVNARFTLDAMPGKQMAIDADLNAGLIDQETARKRRQELSQESDFFGSMDGASKFVSGDAIAGLIILIINIVGGIIVGVAQHSLPLAETARIYVLLTIGDGLVAQIPALVLSLATAIIVTRVTTEETITEQTRGQLFQSTPLYICGGILGLLGLTPGMPNTIFLLVAASVFSFAYFLKREQSKSNAKTLAAQESKPAVPELGWDDVEHVDPIGIDIGYGLIPLVSEDGGGSLMSRIKGIRKKISVELGFLLQSIRVRDSLDIEPESYRININGVCRGKGSIKLGRELAINAGKVYGKLDGHPTKEPAFGLDAIWIDKAQSDYARTLGYTVVDASTAVATHLSKILRESASELFSHDEAQNALNKLSRRFPKLVEDLVPEKLPIGIVTKVLQNLLSESIPVRDLKTIVETLSEFSGQTQSPEQLTNLVRPRLGRLIMQELNSDSSTLEVMTLATDLEQILLTAIQSSKSGDPMLEPRLATSLFDALQKTSRKMENSGNSPVLVVSPKLRAWIARSARSRAPGLTVLSYEEIPEDQDVRVTYTVEANAKE
jgi:flagellar biosynthesis protein FlhA